jgi:pyruvate formate-lyase activating enzyme-like uncharacterized protein
VVFADEVEVERDLDVILEARSIDAKGTGVTGGDPVLRISKVVRYVKLLKRFFGKDHHVHLYTNGRHVTGDILLQLKDAGVDELRFHPERRDWSKIALAKQAGFAVGAEMPAIPGSGGPLRELVEYLTGVKADFLNLNQLEFCPQNAHQMKQRGYILDKGGMASVEGSEETAMSIVNWASENGMEMPIHYCPSSVKDAVQTRKRLIRRGRNVARPYETMDRDGLLSKLTVEIGSRNDYSRVAAKELARRMGVYPWAVGVHSSGRCFEAPTSMLGRVKKVFPQAMLSHVKEYPTALRERFRVLSF